MASSTNTADRLILSTNQCAMYCRHCFRKRMVGLTTQELNERLDQAVAYIRANPSINNILGLRRGRPAQPQRPHRPVSGGAHGPASAGPDPVRLPAAGGAAGAHL